MSTHNLAVTEIVMLFDETVVKRLKRGVSNWLQSWLGEIGEFAMQDTLIDRYAGNDPVSLMVVCVPDRRWQMDETLSLQGQEKLSAGHITKFAVGLHPLPTLAEDSRNLFTPPSPVGTNSGFDLGKIALGNGFSANRERQHIKRIAKQKLGRHKKMHSEQKMCCVDRKLPMSTYSRRDSGWVENKIGGLKIARHTGIWSY